MSKADEKRFERLFLMDDAAGFRDPGFLDAVMILSESSRDSVRSPFCQELKNRLIARGFRVTVIFEKRYEDDKFQKICSELIQKTVLAIVFLDPGNPYLLCRFTSLKARGLPVLTVLDKQAEESGAQALVLLSDLWATSPASVDTRESLVSCGPAIDAFFRNLDGRMSLIIGHHLHENFFAKDRNIQNPGNSRCEDLVFRAFEFLTGVRPYSIEPLSEIYTGFAEQETGLDFSATSILRLLVAQLYLRLGRENIRQGHLETPCYHLAAQIYEKVLGMESSGAVKNQVTKRMGDLYLEMAGLYKDPKFGRLATGYYDDLLHVWADDSHPLERAMVLVNRAMALSSCVAAEGLPSTYEECLRHFQEALEVFNAAEFPLENRFIEEKMLLMKSGLLEWEALKDLSPESGSAPESAPPGQEEDFRQMAGEFLPASESSSPHVIPEPGRFESAVLADPSGDSAKLIRAHSRALEIFTFEEFPLEHATHWKKIGDEYQRLADAREDTVPNLIRSVEAYEEALKGYSLEDLPVECAQIGKKLAENYARLADIENPVENFGRAIVALQKSLEVFRRESFPMDYVILQNELGILFGRLAEIENAAENFERADQAFQKALKVFPRQDPYVGIVSSVEENRRSLLAFWKNRFS